MQKLISYFFSDFNLKFQSRWFKRLLYALLIIQCLYCLCFYGVLFGVNSIFLAKPYPLHSLNDFGFLLYAQASPQAAYYFIIPVLLLSVLQLTGFRVYMIADLIVWFLVVNIHNKMYSALTAGSYLFNHLLLCACFLAPDARPDESIKGGLKVGLHNLAVVAIITQVCLLYVLSGFIKLCDADWLSGKAMLLISEIRHYSLFYFPAKSHLPGALWMVVNYAVILYQCAFPFLVWLKPLKKSLIVAGMIMHLYIALVMGLVEFGAVMLICYIFFWPFRKNY